MFDGQNTQTPLGFQMKASASVFPSVGLRAHIEANFEVIFWQPTSTVGLSVLGMAPYVGDCAVCES